MESTAELSIEFARVAVADLFCDLLQRRSAGLEADDGSQETGAIEMGPERMPGFCRQGPREVLDRELHVRGESSQ